MREDGTRDKIISAAKEVFSQNGYTRATTKEISKVAGVAELTLFRHFKTKSNLFYETIYKYIISSMLDTQLIVSNVDKMQSIMNLIQERIDTLRNNKALFICIIYEAQFNDEIKDMFKKIHTKVFEVLKLYLESNKEITSDIEINDMAQLFLSTIIGVIVFETLVGDKEFVDSQNLIKTIRKIIFE